MTTERFNAEGLHAELDGDFVVFIIGARINKPWRVWEWLPIVLSMRRMYRELEARDGPEGMLGYWGGIMGLRSPTFVQYWRSFEELEAYARNPDASHLPVWSRYNSDYVNSGSMGIWHETYLVSAGQYETIYINMPETGMGTAGRLVPTDPDREDARARIEVAGAPADGSDGRTREKKGDSDIEAKGHQEY